MASEATEVGRLEEEARTLVDELVFAQLERDAAQAEVTALREQLKAAEMRAHMAQLDDSKRDELAALRAEIQRWEEKHADTMGEWMKAEESEAALKARVAELEAPFEMTGDMLRCIDCKALGDDYWLDDAVWSSCVPEDKARTEQGLHTFICSPCFEKRLGRPWRASDFQAGSGPDGFDTNRLTRVAFARAEAAEAERDEWKAKAEAAEKVRGELVQLAATAEVQRDESAALAERLREALTAVGDDVGVMQTSRHDDAVDACAQHALGIIDAALSTPAPAWLRERDRALAMRVAEAVKRHAERYFGRGWGPDLAAIVAEVVP